MSRAVTLSLVGMATLAALVVLAMRAAPAVADYAGRPLPGGALCLVDETGGFPVEQAAAEFDGLPVAVTVGDCTDAEHVAVVRTVMRDESWSGWWNSPNADREHGLISLNLSQAFRIDGEGHWRSILVHEIAHAVGLEHTYEGESIMHPLVGATVHDGLTDTDRAQIEELDTGD